MSKCENCNNDLWDGKINENLCNACNIAKAKQDERKKNYNDFGKLLKRYKGYTHINGLTLRGAFEELKHKEE